MRSVFNRMVGDSNGAGLPVRRGTAWVLVSEHEPDFIFVVTQLTYDAKMDRIGFDVLCEPAIEAAPDLPPSLRCEEVQPGGQMEVFVDRFLVNPLAKTVLRPLGSQPLAVEKLCAALDNA